eukprot:Clim_evm1s80 gene=Clim_evmTU1s80
MSVTLHHAKRSFVDDDDFSTTQHRLAKRCRVNVSPSKSPNTHTTELNRFRATAKRKYEEDFDSVSGTQRTSVEKYVAALRRKNRRMQNDHNDEETFSLGEVTEIVNKAVAEREQNLRAEYDELLRKKLFEQFQSFTKFNEDHIHRQLKSSDFSYMS